MSGTGRVYFLAKRVVGVLVQQAPANRAQALGIHAIGGSLAAVLAPLSIGILLAFVGWREALLISVIPAAIMGLVFLRRCQTKRG